MKREMPAFYVPTKINDLEVQAIVPKPLPLPIPLQLGQSIRSIGTPNPI